MGDKQFVFSEQGAFLEGESQASVRISAYSHISAAVEAFEKFLLAVGYHPDNVRESLGKEE